MSAHQAMYPIRTMARVLKVSASGYYAWRSRPASARATADAGLTRHIRTIHTGSHGIYGAPRVHAELKADGLSVGRKRIARLMRAAGIAGVSRRRSAPITTRQATDHHPASDLVRRNFMAERPNELWVADITFLPTLAGFLYLAVVLDAWSRRIVGWAFSADLKTRVVLDALDMAIVARKLDNVVHHSAARNTRRSLSAIAARKPAFVHRQARSATPTTMRCARVSSPPSSASSSIVAASDLTARRGSPSFSSSKASTIPHAATRPWAIFRPSNTKGNIMA
jgi:putative transposase